MPSSSLIRLDISLRQLGGQTKLIHMPDLNERLFCWVWHDGYTPNERAREFVPTPT